MNKIASKGQFRRALFSLVLVLLMAAGCSNGGTSGNEDSDSGTESDTDSASEVNSETDSEPDSESDSDTYTDGDACDDTRIASQETEVMALLETEESCFSGTLGILPSGEVTSAAFYGNGIWTEGYFFRICPYGTPACQAFSEELENASVALFAGMQFPCLTPSQAVTSGTAVDLQQMEVDAAATCPPQWQLENNNEFVVEVGASGQVEDVRATSENPSSETLNNVECVREGTMGKTYGCLAGHEVEMMGML